MNDAQPRIAHESPTDGIAEPRVPWESANPAVLPAHPADVNAGIAALSGAQPERAAVADGSCSSCASGAAYTPAPTYLYAVGSIHAHFVSLSAEKEFAQSAARVDSEGLTDRQTLRAVVADPSNRYLARQLCWVLSIQGLDTYLLRPRDPSDLDMLIGALRDRPSEGDVDVVVGVSGPIAPPQVCNGLTVPVVTFEQVYSFDRRSLLDAIPRPAKTSKERFAAATEELLDRLLQLTDNVGVADEHRALNYLAIRYPGIYAKTSEAFSRGLSLTGVDTLRPSVSSTRSLVDVVFAYTDRATDFTEKYAVRVDVTEQFPFLVSKLTPFFDR